MKFTVIITVYNASPKYLRECIDSVLNQDYNDIEVIIIDDGSTDVETISELDRYKNINNLNGKELSINRKANGGQGSARNAGLSRATGEYVLFLDSDDYYLYNKFFRAISVLLQQSEADVLSFQYEEFFSDSKRPQLKTGNLPRKKVYNQSKEKAMKALLSAPRSVFSAATHTKALKLSFLRENNIVALEGILNEDIALSAMIINYAEKYDRYDKVVHAYRRTNYSSISAKKENSIAIAGCVLEQLHLLLSSEEYKNNRYILDFLASPYVYWISKMVSAFTSIDDSDKVLYYEYIDLGISYSYLLKYSSRFYVRILGILKRLFGFVFIMNLMRAFLTVNRKHMLSINRKQ